MAAKNVCSRSAMSIAVLLVGAALASTFAGKARSADARVIGDVRCVVVAIHLISTGKPALRFAGVMAAMYYFGRLDGHTSQADLEKLLKAQAKDMSEAALRANALRCGKVLAEKGREITEIGVELSKK